MPDRLQRSRRKGWRMPASAVYVGRPTRWGNPFAVGKSAIDPDSNERVLVRDRAHAVALYRAWLPKQLAEHPDLLPPLKGKDLACWCPLDGPCHADVLLEWANGRQIRVTRR